MIEVLHFRAVERGSLQGFVRIRVPAWHVTIDDIGIHRSNGREWAALPARPQLDADRNVVRDEWGKVKYWRTLFFDTREIADRFSAAVIAAVRVYRSEKKPADTTDGLADFRV